MKMVQPNGKGRVFYRLCFFRYGLYIAVIAGQLKLKVSALVYANFKPLKIHDCQTQSAIDSIFPPV